MAETDYLDPGPGRLATQLNKTELRHRILGLSRRGVSPYRISVALGEGDSEKGIAPVQMSPEQVKATIKRYLEHVHGEDAITIEALRVMENERLDEWQRALETELYITETDSAGRTTKKLNLRAMDRLLKLSDRRARMNGLDAPQRIEVAGAVQVLHEMGVDPERIEAAEEAFVSSFGRNALDPGIVDAVEVKDEDPLDQLEAARAPESP